VRKVRPMGAARRAFPDEGREKRMEGEFGRMNRECREQGSWISRPRRQFLWTLWIGPESAGQPVDDAQQENDPNALGIGAFS
jgi:hypothetical protein